MGNEGSVNERESEKHKQWFLQAYKLSKTPKNNPAHLKMLKCWSVELNPYYGPKGRFLASDALILTVLFSQLSNFMKVQY